MDFNQIIQYLQHFITTEALRQLVAFGLLLIAAYVLAKVIEWVLERILRRWLETLSWLAGAFAILKSVLFPLLALGLGSVVMPVFGLQGWATEILVWLLPLLSVWMIYRLAKNALYLALPYVQARRLYVRLVIPLTLVLIGLHIAGVLTNFWDYRAEILQAAVLVLIFFVAKIPVEPLRRQLDKVQIRVLRSPILEILPAARHAIPTLMWALHPLIAWILGMAVIALYSVLGVVNDFTAWAGSFFLLWFLYEVARALIPLRLTPANGKRAVRILQIVVLVVAALHSVDRLRVIWELGLWQVGENAWVEFGGLVTGLVIMVLTILLSRTTRVVLRQRLPARG